MKPAIESVLLRIDEAMEVEARENPNIMQTIRCETFHPSWRKRMKTMTPSRRPPETDRTMFLLLTRTHEPRWVVGCARHTPLSALRMKMVGTFTRDSFKAEHTLKPS